MPRRPGSRRAPGGVVGIGEAQAGDPASEGPRQVPGEGRRPAVGRARAVVHMAPVEPLVGAVGGGEGAHGVPDRTAGGGVGQGRTLAVPTRGALGVEEGVERRGVARRTEACDEGGAGAHAQAEHARGAAGQPARVEPQEPDGALEVADVPRQAAGHGAVAGGLAPRLEARGAAAAPGEHVDAPGVHVGFEPLVGVGARRRLTPPRGGVHRHDHRGVGGVERPHLRSLGHGAGEGVALGLGVEVGAGDEYREALHGGGGRRQAVGHAEPVIDVVLLVMAPGGGVEGEVVVGVDVHGGPVVGGRRSGRGGGPAARGEDRAQGGGGRGRKKAPSRACHGTLPYSPAVRPLVSRAARRATTSPDRCPNPLRPRPSRMGALVHDG